MKVEDSQSPSSEQDNKYRSSEPDNKSPSSEPDSNAVSLAKPCDPASAALYVRRALETLYYSNALENLCNKIKVPEREMAAFVKTMEDPATLDLINSSLPEWWNRTFGVRLATEVFKPILSFSAEDEGDDVALLVHLDFKVQRLNLNDTFFHDLLHREPFIKGTDEEAMTTSFPMTDIFRGIHQVVSFELLQSGRNKSNEITRAARAARTLEIMLQAIYGPEGPPPHHIYSFALTNGGSNLALCLTETEETRLARMTALQNTKKRAREAVASSTVFVKKPRPAAAVVKEEIVID